MRSPTLCRLGAVERGRDSEVAIAESVLEQEEFGSRARRKRKRYAVRFSLSVTCRIAVDGGIEEQ